MKVTISVLYADGRSVMENADVSSVSVAAEHGGDKMTAPTVDRVTLSDTGLVVARGSTVVAQLPGASS